MQIANYRSKKKDNFVAKYTVGNSRDIIRVFEDITAEHSNFPVYIQINEKHISFKKMLNLDRLHGVMDIYVQTPLNGQVRIFLTSVCVTGEEFARVENESDTIQKSEGTFDAILEKFKNHHIVTVQQVVDFIKKVAPTGITATDGVIVIFRTKQKQYIYIIDSIAVSTDNDVIINVSTKTF